MDHQEKRLVVTSRFFNGIYFALQIVYFRQLPVSVLDKLQILWYIVVNVFIIWRMSL